ncbi:head-tail connector protein [Rhizobium sp. SYY.PMSO]|uniref:head-tail connector protein n=1 Tax=Rhizobium sp. SYY.PMSO TaxID=3382192 RepID=UPI0039902321
MPAFVSLETVKMRLKIDFADDDALLDGLIDAATDAVINYLKSAAEQYLDSGGSVPSGIDIPPVIQTATVMMVGYLYRNPDQDPDRDFDPGYLPGPVISLLYPLRDPALA